MSEIQYDGLAIPTAYRGRMYRSRLEAMWADVQPMWADACNAVQYRPRRRSRRRALA